jgi:hypothetical protein
MTLNILNRNKSSVFWDVILDSAVEDCRNLRQMYLPSSSGSKSNPSKQLAANRVRKSSTETNKLAGSGDHYNI